MFFSSRVRLGLAGSGGISCMDTMCESAIQLTLLGVLMPEGPGWLGGDAPAWADNSSCDPPAGLRVRMGGGEGDALAGESLGLLGFTVAVNGSSGIDIILVSKRSLILVVFCCALIAASSTLYGASREDPFSAHAKLRTLNLQPSVSSWQITIVSV